MIQLNGTGMGELGAILGHQRLPTPRESRMFLWVEVSSSACNAALGDEQYRECGGDIAGEITTQA